VSPNKKGAPSDQQPPKQVGANVPELGRGVKTPRVQLRLFTEPMPAPLLFLKADMRTPIQRAIIPSHHPIDRFHRMPFLLRSELNRLARQPKSRQRIPSPIAKKL
jgi:hypothetical protein